MSEQHPLLSRVLGEAKELTCEIRFPHLDEPEVFRFRRISGAETLRLKRTREVDQLRLIKDIRKVGGSAKELAAKAKDGRDGAVEIAAEYSDAVESNSERADDLAANCLVLSLLTGEDGDGKPYPPLTLDDAYDLLAVTGGSGGKLARTAMDACGLLDGAGDDDEAIDLPA